MSFGRIAVTLRGLVEASHPFPLAAVLALTALIALASAETLDTLDWSRLGLVLLAMFMSQLSIGWTNDYVDRGHDALYQPSKPLAGGRMNPRLLPPLAIGAATASLGLVGVTFGASTFVWFALGTGAGLAYDLRLKDTRWSWWPFLVAFAVLPPYVWSAMGSYREELLIAYPIALPLALAVHIANTLPDLESDRAAGRGGVVATMGQGPSLILLYVGLETPIILVLASLFVIDYDASLLIATLASYIVIELVAARLYFLHPIERGARLAFRPLVAGAIVFVGGLLASL